MKTRGQILATALLCALIVGCDGSEGGPERAPGFTGLPPYLAGDAWDYAVRAYPNGIPAGVHHEAMEELYALETVDDDATHPGIDHDTFELVMGNVWYPIGPAPISDNFGYG